MLSNPWVFSFAPRKGKQAIHQPLSTGPELARKRKCSPYSVHIKFLWIELYIKSHFQLFTVREFEWQTADKKVSNRLKMSLERAHPSIFREADAGKRVLGMSLKISTKIDAKTTFNVHSNTLHNKNKDRKNRDRESRIESTTTALHLESDGW